MKRTALFAALAPLALAGSLHGATDYLLELDGIKGESSDSRYPSAIEIESFSWGCSNAGRTGTPTGQVTFFDMGVSGTMGRGTPQIFLACASGSPIKRAVLHVRKAGDQQEYYTIEMQDVLVASYHQSGASADSTATGIALDSRPKDGFKLYYTSAVVTHVADDGTVTRAEIVRPAQ